jgi:hypothetical protein
MPKSLKTPKGQSESVNRNKTDNAIVKFEDTKGQSEAVNWSQTDNAMAKSLKIPKGQSEAVNRWRTDNTMAKRKRTYNDLQNTTQKTKDWSRRPH